MVEEVGFSYESDDGWVFKTINNCDKIHVTNTKLAVDVLIDPTELKDYVFDKAISKEDVTGTYIHSLIRDYAIKKQQQDGK